MVKKVELERQLKMAHKIIGNLMGELTNVRWRINNGYVETATKHIDEMQANGWEKAGWKELHSAMYDNKVTP